MQFLRHIKEVLTGLRRILLIPINAREVAKLNANQNIEIPGELIWGCRHNMHGSQSAHEMNQTLYSAVIEDGDQVFFDISPELRIALPGLANAKDIAVNDIREIIMQKVYEFGNVTLSKGDVVLDVGASIGIYSMMAYNQLHETREGHLVCIEPISDIGKVLKFNLDYLRKNNVDDGVTVSFIDKAVMDYPQTTKMALQDDCFTMHRLARKRDKGRVVNIQASTIDLIVDQLSLAKVDFIKMDIEGAEVKALLGARNTLRKWQPKLAISAYHSPVDFWKIPKTIVEINPEYKVAVRCPSGPMCYAW